MKGEERQKKNIIWLFFAFFKLSTKKMRKKCLLYQENVVSLHQVLRKVK